MYNSKQNKFIFAGMMAALTIIGSYIIIPLPFTPVPITLQTFFVLFSGLIAGVKIGFLSQLVYLLLGAIGLPVFAGGTAGLGIFLSPTGGFLLSFPFAALVSGLSKFKSIKKSIGLLIIAKLLIYTFGVFFMIKLWDYNFYGALAIGVFPFFPGDLVKIICLILLKIRLSNMDFINNINF